VGRGPRRDIKVGRLPATGVEASFSDIVSVLDVGLMAAFEGRRGPWGFLVDGFYVKMSDTVAAKNPQFGNADVEMVQEIYTLGGSYRALEGKTSVDVLFGTRYASIDSDLALSGGIASGRAVSGGGSWWDGFVGGRVLYRPTDHWSIMGYADVGAGSDDVSWQVIAGGGYEFKKLVALRFGYRYISFDYHRGQLVYDMAIAGPYLGVGFRF
jgi:opacity protein-like surface antigen